MSSQVETPIFDNVQKLYLSRLALENIWKNKNEGFGILVVGAFVKWKAEKYFIGRIVRTELQTSPYRFCNEDTNTVLVVDDGAANLVRVPMSAASSQSVEKGDVDAWSQRMASMGQPIPSTEEFQKCVARNYSLASFYSVQRRLGLKNEEPTHSEELCNKRRRVNVCQLYSDSNIPLPHVSNSEQADRQIQADTAASCRAQGLYQDWHDYPVPRATDDKASTVHNTLRRFFAMSSVITDQSSEIQSLKQDIASKERELIAVGDRSVLEFLQGKVDILKNDLESYTAELERVKTASQDRHAAHLAETKQLEKSKQERRRLMTEERAEFKRQETSRAKELMAEKKLRASLNASLKETTVQIEAEWSHCVECDTQLVKASGDAAQYHALNKSQEELAGLLSKQVTETSQFTLEVLSKLKPLVEIIRSRGSK